MATVLTSTCTVRQLYFRFWGGVGQVHDYVCPITDTPHYRFALGMARGTGLGPRQLPEGTGYGRYARWERHCFGQDTGHNEYTFRDNILRWRGNFDLTAHPIQVAQFADSNGTPCYYVTDGAHRAAYAAALVGANQMADRITIVIVPAPSNWPQPRGVGTIENFAPGYRGM